MSASPDIARSAALGSSRQPTLVRAVQDDLRPTLVCFSHLRWNFVWQRPQHLMTRFARDRRVIYVEESIPAATAADVRLEVRIEPSGVEVVVPHVDATQDASQQRTLLDAYLAKQRLGDVTLWYYTPMSLVFSDHLRADRIVYDCMDELSAFRFCPPELIQRERQLMDRADVVFTGGHSLYRAKRRMHANVHAFPSSVDISHFARARRPVREPADLRTIARPRLGFFGVIDERFDVCLVEEVAQRRPEWQVVLIGPVVKIDPATLPRLPNIHYLGSKQYAELPDYLAHWDVAIMPFAMNDATRFISPTKTPEYLAGGCPVVSTPIADVISTYGDCTAVRIARTAVEFEDAVLGALIDREDLPALRTEADRFLRANSWDITFDDMASVMAKTT